MSSFRKYIRTIEDKKLPSVEKGQLIYIKYKEYTGYGIVHEIRGKKVCLAIMNQWGVPFSYSSSNGYWTSELNPNTGKDNKNDYLIYDLITEKLLKELLHD